MFNTWMIGGLSRAAFGRRCSMGGQPFSAALSTRATRPHCCRARGQQARVAGVHGVDLLAERAAAARPVASVLEAHSGFGGRPARTQFSAGQHPSGKGYYSNGNYSCLRIRYIFGWKKCDTTRSRM